MKTKEELNALKEEVEALNRKLHELTDEELEQVAGGATPDVPEEEHSEPADAAGCYEDAGAANIGGYEGSLIFSER